MFGLQFSVLILTLWDEGVGLRNMDTLLLQYKLLGRNVASSIDHIWAQVHFPTLQWPNKRLFFFPFFFGVIAILAQYINCNYQEITLNNLFKIVKLF